MGYMPKAASVAVFLIKTQLYIKKMERKKKRLIFNEYAAAVKYSHFKI